MHITTPPISLIRLAPLLLLAFLCSCNATKHVPAGKYLLEKNEIRKNGEKSREGDIRRIIKQKPNSRTLFGAGPRLYLAFYNWGRPESEKGFGKWLANRGEAPVIFDSIRATASARQIGFHLYNKGYFEAETGFRVKYNDKRKRARVIYDIYTGPRYRITSIKTDIHSPRLGNLYRRFSEQSELEEGMAYDLEVLDAERSRLATIFRDYGHYNFSRELIHYEADTTGGKPSVDLTLVIRDRPVYDRDSVRYEPHRPYTITGVYIQTDFELRRAGEVPQDTSRFLSYVFVNRDTLLYHPRVVTDALHFEPGDLYSRSDVQQSYRHINRLRLFRSTEISFHRNDSDTLERGLIARVRLSPMSKRNFTAEIQATNTSGNYGIFSSAGWKNRNVFRGGELFDLRLFGGLESQINTAADDRIFNTYELGAETSLHFPKFLLPFNTLGLLPKRMEPRSRLYASVSRQSRIQFDRLVIKGGIEYVWKESEPKTHTIHLAEVSYTDLYRLQPDFFSETGFLFGFVPALTSASRYTFVYNDQKINEVSNHQFFRGSLELAGNTLSLYDEIQPLERNSEGNYTLFGVGIAQYARIEADYRYYWSFPGSHELAFRLFTAYLHSYGKGGSVVPFERLFFIGGTNDLRAFTAYRQLGPGNYRPGGDEVIVAPIKGLATVEYRFPMYRRLKGAFFTDAGNIWERRSPLEGRNLRGDTFFRQLAVGAGFGLRYDFGFFVLRLDLAQIVRTPWKEDGRHWFSHTFNPTYNFGIGYPF